MSRRLSRTGSLPNASYAGDSHKLHAKDSLKSLIPPSLLGLKEDNVFKSVTHRNEHAQKFSKFLNNGVDDNVSMVFYGADGVTPVTEPFMFQGQMRYPDSKGRVRFVNKGQIETVQSIKNYQEEMLQKAINLCLLGDDVAAYILGLSLDDWNEMCKKGNIPPGDTSKWSDELQNQDCTIENMESLVPGSQLQLSCMAKLRKVVKFYLKNINVEAFDSLSEKVADAGKGITNEPDDAPPTRASASA